MAQDGARTDFSATVQIVMKEGGNAEEEQRSGGLTLKGAAGPQSNHRPGGCLSALPGEKSPPASLSQRLQPLLSPCRMLLVLDGRGCPFRSRRSRLGRRAYTGLRLRNGRPRCHIL